MIVSLEKFGAGVAVERFNEEMEKVIKNITDFNTDHKLKREVTLTIKLTPNEERDRCHLEIHTKSKLAPPKAVESLMFVGVDSTGAAHSEEYIPDQKKMFPEGEQKEGGKIAGAIG